LNFIQQGSATVNILTVLQGYKTYIAAAGLVGLAIYQFSTGQLQEGVQTLLGAAAAAGLHSAIVSQPIAHVVVVPGPMGPMGPAGPPAK
jgi:hypothetical protein